MERNVMKCHLVAGEHKRNLWMGGRLEGHVERRGGEEVDGVWGQRWLPVCLWNTSQLALTIKSTQEN